MKKISKITIGCLAALAFASCATTLRTTVLRPAELNTNGAKTIAVLPFQRDAESYNKIFSSNTQNNNGMNAQLINIITIGGSNSQPTQKETPEEINRREISDIITDSLNNSFSTSQYLDLVDARAVQNSIQNGTKNPADVYLSGYVSSFKEDISTRAKQEKNSQNQTISRTYYTRKATATISYEIIDSATQKVLAKNQETVSQSSSETADPNSLESAQYILRNSLNNLAKSIVHKVQPYEITRSLVLAKPKAKNEAFNSASLSAKNGALDAAESEFVRLYKEENIPEAGYNAALIMEAKGNYKEAETLMDEVLKKSHYPKASQALAEIRNEINQQKKLEAQLEQQSSSR